jgi:hypothetical protein
MAELVAWFDETVRLGALPLLALGFFAVVFLEIHPFCQTDTFMSKKEQS